MRLEQAGRVPQWAIFRLGPRGRVEMTQFSEPESPGQQRQDLEYDTEGRLMRMITFQSRSLAIANPGFLSSESLGLASKESRREVSFTYDSRGLLQRRGDWKYIFDDDGFLIERRLIDASLIDRFSYNSKGLLILAERSLTAPITATAATSFGTGRRRSIVEPDGLDQCGQLRPFRIQFFYDAEDRLVVVRDILAVKDSVQYAYADLSKPGRVSHLVHHSRGLVYTFYYDDMDNGHLFAVEKKPLNLPPANIEPDIGRELAGYSGQNADSADDVEEGGHPPEENDLIGQFSKDKTFLLWQQRNEAHASQLAARPSTPGKIFFVMSNHAGSPIAAFTRQDKGTSLVWAAEYTPTGARRITTHRFGRAANSRLAGYQHLWSANPGSRTATASSAFGARGHDWLETEAEASSPLLPFGHRGFLVDIHTGLAFFSDPKGRRLPRAFDTLSGIFTTPDWAGMPTRRLARLHAAPQVLASHQWHPEVDDDDTDETNELELEDEDSIYSGVSGTSGTAASSTSFSSGATGLACPIDRFRWAAQQPSWWLRQTGFRLDRLLPQIDFRLAMSKSLSYVDSDEDNTDSSSTLAIKPAEWTMSVPITESHSAQTGVLRANEMTESLACLVEGMNQRFEEVSVVQASRLTPGGKRGAGLPSYFLPPGERISQGAQGLLRLATSGPFLGPQVRFTLSPWGELHLLQNTPTTGENYSYISKSSRPRRGRAKSPTSFSDNRGGSVSSDLYPTGSQDLNSLDLANHLLFGARLLDSWTEFATSAGLPSEQTPVTPSSSASLIASYSSSPLGAAPATLAFQTSNVGTVVGTSSNSGHVRNRPGRLIQLFARGFEPSDDALEAYDFENDNVVNMAYGINSASSTDNDATVEEEAPDPSTYKSFTSSSATSSASDSSAYLTQSRLIYRAGTRRTLSLRPKEGFSQAMQVLRALGLDDWARRALQDYPIGDTVKEIASTR
ncbi:unnamed protein product [Protopolystoma xenopodis]|uniref:Teneurin-like YD-shell domain-containing protein n=1 Tax=Protopolystoma xenopodis TaxID=117903 RepID=A0A448WBD7_9PLAT|nr:unnamed protein product [Protopolystoma xenopodis]